MSKPVILCVDDEKTVLDSLRLQLRESFDEVFDIEIAESGEQAIEIIEELVEHEIELPVVISDQIMPGLKGDALLIYVHRVLPNTLKVLLTGQASADAVGNAVNKANLYRYIAKPWESTDLILTVNEATKSYFQSKKVEEQTQQLEQLVAELKNMNETLEDKVQKRTAEIALQRDEIITQKAEIEAKNKELIALHEKEKRFMELEIQNQKLQNEKATFAIKIKEEENLRLQAEAEKKVALNEKLSSEITSTALYISQKNELLAELKKELQQISKNVNDRTKTQLKRFIRNIDNHTQMDNDWERFKMHFENANNGFFSKLTSTHPDLTPNELKLCAYLRINLSTKEIANLLNCSVRSVESNRYRLRKKLTLTSEDSLVMYMQEV